MLPGMKIKEIMGDRYTQQQCEAYFAAMKTWMVMTPDLTAEKAFQKFIDATGGKIDVEEAAEVSVVIHGQDVDLYGINVGHSPEKAIVLNEVIPDRRQQKIAAHLGELFGEGDRDYFLHRTSYVTWRGESLAVVVVLRADGQRHRVYFR